MATTNTIYHNFINRLFGGGVSLSKDSFRIALMTSAYTPSASDTYTYDDLIPFEAMGTGYAEGGKPIAFSGTVVQEGNIKVYSPGVCWQNATITFRTIVIYREDGLLVSFYNFAEDQVVIEQDYQVSWKVQPLLAIMHSDSIAVDTALDVSSLNPVANSVVTNALRNVGIRLNGEDIGESALKNNVDEMDKLPLDEVDEMFRATR